MRTLDRTAFPTKSVGGCCTQSSPSISGKEGALVNNACEFYWYILISYLFKTVLPSKQQRILSIAYFDVWKIGTTPIMSKWAVYPSANMYWRILSALATQDRCSNMIKEIDLLWQWKQFLFWGIILHKKVQIIVNLTGPLRVGSARLLCLKFFFVSDIFFFPIESASKFLVMTRQIGLASLMLDNFIFYKQWWKIQFSPIKKWQNTRQ